MEKPVQYTIRNYAKGDETDLAKIFSECFGPVTARMIRQWHRMGPVRPESIFLGEVDGNLVSHVNTESKELHHGEGVFIKTAGVAGVCTDSDYRKKGIVTHLLKQALDHAQLEGFSNASLFTELDGPAHGIYQRNGFIDVATHHTYVKYLDYPFIFARWLRHINRALKHSKIAATKLEGWEKSVSIRLKEVGTLSFKFRKNRFQRLKKPPELPDVEFSTDLQTYARITRRAFKWEDAVESGKLTVKRGTPSDIEMVKRIVHWRWHD